MEFCDNCGSRMNRTKDGFVCPRCGVAKRVRPEAQVVKEKGKDDSSSIFVSGESTTSHLKISRKCPSCGHAEAFHWFSGVSGEHAGIRQERTMEHFRCAKCACSWTEGS